jgi:hypothetical protein
VLTLLWTVTDHAFAHSNENLLIFNPLWLAAVLMVPLTFTSGRFAHATRILTMALASLCALALIGHLVRLSSQSNLAIVALAFPPAMAIALVMQRLRRPAGVGSPNSVADFL